MHKSAVETGKRAAFIFVAALVLTLPLHGQPTPNDAPVSASVPPNRQADDANRQTQQEIVQELDAMKRRIEQLEAELKIRAAAEASPAAGTTTSMAVAAPVTAVATARAAVAQTSSDSSTAAPAKQEKIAPFSDWDWTWPVSYTHLDVYKRQLPRKSHAVREA